MGRAKSKKGDEGNRAKETRGKSKKASRGEETTKGESGEADEDRAEIAEVKRD